MQDRQDMIHRFHGFSLQSSRSYASVFVEVDSTRLQTIFCLADDAPLYVQFADNPEHGFWTCKREIKWDRIETL